MLCLKSFFFAVLGPGTVTVLIPYLLITRAHAAGPVGWWNWLGLLPIGVGLGILVCCISDFAVKGRGTLAPIDPPRQLIVTGLYRYVRNPMYLGVLLVLLGEACQFGSLTLFAYAGLFFTMVHLFVVLYEERALGRQFGESYGRYCRDVRRWLPRRPTPR